MCQHDKTRKRYRTACSDGTEERPAQLQQRRDALTGTDRQDGALQKVNGSCYLNISCTERSLQCQ